jgi:lysosomal alpha-glucosidase
MKPIDQDPAALGHTVIISTKRALEKRYSLIAYLYTLFYRAQQFSETVVRPLFFEFPQDMKAYENDYQFLWGSSVMIMPVLTINVTKINAYFPSGNWYLYEANGLNSIERVIKSKGEYIQLDAPLEKINVAVRGGSILPILPPKTTTTETRKQNFTLLVALNDNESANGELFWDDGDSLDPIHNGKYTLVSFNAVKVTQS